MTAAPTCRSCGTSWQPASSLDPRWAGFWQCDACLAQLEQCHACGSTAWRWLDCEACPAGECPERVCIDCGASVGN